MKSTMFFSEYFIFLAQEIEYLINNFELILALLIHLRGSCTTWIS